MAIETATFVASDGYAHYVTLHRAVQPRGRILAWHGIQSHGGWYHASSQLLAQAGYEVLFLDRRGSGNNSRDRGHAFHADRLVHDVVQFHRWAARTVPLRGEVPVFWLGLSWGARPVTVAAARWPELVAGLILLYPGLFPLIYPTRLEQHALALAEWLGDFRRMIALPLGDPSLFTDDPSAQQFIRDDPLALHHATTGFLAASFALERRATAALARLRVPLFVALAGQDQICDSRRTQAAISSCNTTVKLRLYEDAAHTLEFAACREEFVRDLTQWLELQSSRAL